MWARLTGRWLDLSRCELTADHLSFLLQSRRRDFERLSAVSLAYNQIDDPAVIVQLIDVAARTLTQLNIAGNPLVDRDGKAVSDSVLAARQPRRLREYLVNKSPENAQFDIVPVSAPIPSGIDSDRTQEVQRHSNGQVPVVADRDPEQKMRDLVLKTIGRHGESGVSETKLADFLTDEENTPTDRKKVGRYCTALEAQGLIVHRGEFKNSRWLLSQYRDDAGPESPP